MPDSVPLFTLVDVPGAVPLLGHLGAFKKQPLQMLSAWWRQHGDAIRFRPDQRLFISSVILISPKKFSSSKPIVS